MTTPQKQKALFLEYKGGPFVVRETDVPIPSPEEILVHIEAAALNPSDWKIQAWKIVVENYPAILGFDGAGTVVEVGASVRDKFVVGDRVTLQGWFADEGRTAHGTFRQYHAVRPDTVAKIPANVSIEGASSIACGVATAAFSLYNEGAYLSPSLYEPDKLSSSSAKLVPPWESRGRGAYSGKPIIVLGGASAVGQYVLQLVRISGFSPIITTASPHNQEYLRSLGATHVLDRHLPEDTLIERVHKIAGVEYFDLVYDAVCRPETLPIGYAMTAPTGEFVILSPGDMGVLVDEKLPKTVHLANGLLNAPVNKVVSESLRASIGALLESGELKHMRIEVLPGGLHGVVPGLERVRGGKVVGKKLVVRPQDTA
ncbi:GroES-like protein [Trametes meyenii]|nr:GroES-like protein [Trametes meyenii]